MVKIHISNELLLVCGDAIPFHLHDPAVLLRFRQIAERDIGASARSQGLDDEYRLHDVLCSWIDRVCKLRPVDRAAVADRLLAAELDFERKSISADDDIVQTIEQDGATRRIYISDFYIPKELLDTLIEAAGLAKYFDHGYVSCDAGLNKRSGRLFDHVRMAEGVTDDLEWHHYGDNAHSDVRIPQERGITAHHYLPIKQHERRLATEKTFDDRTKHLNAIFASATQEHPDSARLALPLILGYILFVQEECRRLGIENLYFFTREGEFFIQAYEAVRQASPIRDTLPRGQLLEVSRLATFSPSLSEFSPSEMMRIWNLYSSQSMGALFKSLDFELDPYATAMSRHGLDPQAVIRYPWEHPGVQAFFSDASVQEIAKAQIQRKRAEALAYFSKKLPADATKSVMVVDIGWRGTIQDNLAHLFSRTPIHGVYLGLSKLLNQQPKNATKAAYGPDLNRSPAHAELLRFVAPIEMMCNSPNGSVVRYLEGAAQREIDQAENAVYENFTQGFQRALIHSIQRAAPEVFRHAYDSRQVKDLALVNWGKLITSPPADILNAYFNLSHNETFGVGHYISKIDKVPSSWLFIMLLSKAGRRRARQRLSALGWIDGYLLWRNDAWLTKLVRLLYPSQR